MESRRRAYASSQNENKIPNKLKRPTSYLTTAENESWEHMWRQQEQNEKKQLMRPVHDPYFFYIPRYATFTGGLS